MSNATKALIRLVEKSASEQSSAEQAQQLIHQGADIKALTKNGPMIHVVIAEEKRQRQTMAYKADNCLRLIQILQKAASDQLKAQVLSGNGGNLEEMRLLVNLKANCYQSETCGPLGLLGALVAQDKIPIRMEIVKFLVESDTKTRRALIAVDNHGKTCLSLAKTNSLCSKNVIEYMQQQIDEIVNHIPFTQSSINPNEITKWVLEGANLEATDKNGNTVLSNAVSANNLELVRALVSAGSNTGHKNHEGYTLLQIAKKAVPRNPPLITLLEEQTVNLELRKLIETKKAMLTMEEVQHLLENGANINASLINGDSPLHLLIANEGTVDMVKVFLDDFNADLSITNNKGYRPIETCVMIDKKPFLSLQTILAHPKMTLDKFRNAKLNKSLVEFATEQKRCDAAKLIQDELNLRLWNCILNANTNEDNNKNIIDVVNQLIACGAEINHLHTDEEYNQWTVLHLVCKQATVSMLQYLIKYHNADYTVKNNSGDYPIFKAAEYGHLPMIEYLSNLSKANLTFRNAEMQTLLHSATKNNHLLIVRYLVKWGIDEQARDRSKRTALDIARENVPKNKDDEINNKKIIQLLTELDCPPVDHAEGASMIRKKPTYNLDVCDLPTPVVLNPIIENVDDEDATIGKKTKGLFSVSPNANLHEAARIGDVLLAQKSIGEGADIRFRKGNHTPYEIALISLKEYDTKLRTAMPIDAQFLRATAARFQQIVQMIQHIAHTKMIEAIQQSNVGLVVAYHRAGAPITVDLLYKTCNTSDNVEIAHYLISQNVELQEAVKNDVSPNAPYRIAKAKKFQKLAMYLKYQLSTECTKAIKENNLVLVQKLISTGASVELGNTNNLNEAIKNQNPEMIRLLCENGAKMPTDWLSANTITLEPSISRNMSPNIVSMINQYLVERRLRFAAANGDFDEAIRCQRLGVDINSKNCHGSTALLCTLLHGNYFRIVHTLVSHGASMLHSNENVQISLINIANEYGYTQTAEYLSKELNKQFLSAVLNSDRQSAEKFAQLGADFNYKDEQERTALHYAVQYHGIDLVAWLCECGSVPTICDINGDYPIIQAVEKGDYAVVELFVTKYPATKKQTNKNEMTALQIAQKLKFNRIVQLIETGKGISEFGKDVDDKSNEPKHSEQVLIQAARNGHIKIIREFIAERYESKEKKKKLCHKLLEVAKKASQFEVLDALEPYYKTELKTELASDMHAGSNIVLSDRYKKILLGVLGSLNNLIAHSSVLLDPSDPNTYTQFFIGLNENVAKQTEELQQVKTEQDVKKLIHQDDSSTKEQLEKIQEQLEELLESRNNLEARVLETDDRLFKEQKLTALQRKEFLKEKELHQHQLATYECSIFLFQRQQEAILNRQKAIEFLKSNTNMMMFYRTIENRLEALFHSYLAAQGGYVKVEATTKFDKAGKLLSSAPIKLVENIPIVNIAAAITKTVLGTVLSKLDEKQQKREWHNLSTLGNIEELRRIASETAGLVTLYYSEQIQLISPLQKMKGSNIFNDKVNWLKQIYSVRPESSEEMAVVIVAEYVTAWIIDGLKMGSGIDANEEIPQQLWLHVAKTDPTDLGKINKITDVIGVSVGKQKIPVKVNSHGEEKTIPVQLRYLIGCVSVIGNDGNVYQYPNVDNNTDEELKNLEYFGYVYVTPFSSDQKALRLILEGRKLHLAKRDTHGNLLTRFEDIAQHAQAFIKHHDQADTKSTITRETAEQLAEVLREQKVFVDSTALKDELATMQQNVEVSVDVLREELEEKASYYQVSIDAAHEQIKQESEENRKAMKKDNDVRYEQAIKGLNQRSEEITKSLEELIKKRMDDIEQYLQRETEKIMAVAETAKAQSLTAMAKAQEASETSRQAVENSGKAANSAENLTKWAQQLNEEFQLTMQKCEKVTKQTAFEQKQSCEQTISDIRTKAQQDIERSREAATKSAADSKESARSAKDSQSTTQDIQKMMKNELEAHKAEIKKMMAETKESRQESERVASQAKEAQKQATQAANTSTTAVEKINALQSKVERALQEMEKLMRNLPSS